MAIAADWYISSYLGVQADLIPRRIIRFVIGNPLIMMEMAKHVPTGILLAQTDTTRQHGDACTTIDANRTVRQLFGSKRDSVSPLLEPTTRNASNLFAPDSSSRKSPYSNVQSDSQNLIWSDA